MAPEAPRNTRTTFRPFKDPRSRDRNPMPMPSMDGQRGKDDKVPIPPPLKDGGGWGAAARKSRKTNTSKGSTWNNNSNSVGGSGSGWGQRTAGTASVISGSGGGWGQETAGSNNSTAGDWAWGPWRGDRDATSDDGGWPTVKATEGKEWTPRSTTDTAMAEAGEEDQQDSSTSSSAPPQRGRRLYAFNAKISSQPCSCLIKVFGRDEETKSIQISKDSDYTVWEVEESMSKRKDEKFKFVGIFTNPIDGERFLCGRSGGDWKDVAFELVKMPSIDGKTVWVPCYSSKANARHAAAARALDCISLRSTNGEETYGMCKDLPYLDPADGPSLPRDAPVSTRVEGAMAEDSNGASGEASASIVGPTSRNAPLPKAQLQLYYQQLYLDFTTIGTYFFSFDNGDDQDMLHTAVFVDPTNVTEHFGCGRYVENGKSPSYEVTSEDMGGDGTRVDVVWYRRKKDAEHAAAARALDCIRLRESGISRYFEESSFPRLCEEPPYLSTDDASPLPLRFQLEIETYLSEAALPIISNRKRVRDIPMETDEEVAHRQEYRLSRMPEGENLCM